MLSMGNVGKACVENVQMKGEHLIVLIVGNKTKQTKLNLVTYTQKSG